MFHTKKTQHNMKKILYSMLMLMMASLTFTSCEDVPAPYDQPKPGDDTPATPEVAEGDGTAASPFNVIAVNNFIKAGEGLDKYVYIKGVVSQVKECSAQFGNATFYITEDGTGDKTSFYVYRVKGLGNQKITSDDAVKVGDNVVIYAQVVDYNGTYETAQNTGYIYSLNGNTAGGDTPAAGEAKGDGTKDNPFNCVAANQAASKLAADTESDQEYYIKGKVCEVKSAYAADAYGNAMFYISDDGTATNKFYCFHLLYLGNTKYTGGTNIAVGDDVVVCAKIVNFKGNTPETVGNKGWLVELNSKGGDTPGGDTPGTAEGITISGTTLTLTNAAVTAGTETISVNAEDMGIADEEQKGVDATKATLSDGTVITFDQNGGKNAPKYFGKYTVFRLYADNKLTITGKKPIAKVEFTCDAVGSTNYVGNETATMTASGNDIVYVNKFTGTTGGGVQMRFKSIKITYAK